MNEEMLEILIGKHIDAEITPAEQRMLDDELERNAVARATFEQFKRLHDEAKEAVASVLAGGPAAEEVIERALRRVRPVSVLRAVFGAGSLRFAAGLAAGLMIGVGVHMASLSARGGDVVAPGQDAGGGVAAMQSGPGALVSEVLNATGTAPSGKVDWYNFTDSAGAQWVVERYRQDMVRPAVYYDGL